jgi:mono/diheme cytochrome c family protein
MEGTTMGNRTLKVSGMGIGLALAGCLLVQPAPIAAAPAAQAEAPVAAPSRAMIDQYCVTCHSERLKRGQLVLENRDLAKIGEDAEIWEKVVRKLRNGQMPPMGARKPEAADRTGFLNALVGTLDQFAAANPNPGRHAIHRLNRVEYANAIRDLLKLEVSGQELLPADDSGHGFDNIAEALTVSPRLLERYISAAQKVARLAVGDPTIKPVATTYTVSYFQVQDDRASDDLPFGSRGGLAVQHYFPLDGEYEVQVRLQRHAVNLGGGIRGLDEQNWVDIRVDGQRLELIEVGGGDAEKSGSTRGPYSETEEERFADDKLFVRFPIKAGMRTLGISFIRNLWQPEGVGVSRLPVASYGFASGRVSHPDYGKVEMAVDFVDLTGPYDGKTPESTPSREAIFTCRPATAAEEVPCAKSILTRLARRAYRRPVNDGDVKAMMGLYAEGRAQGDFDQGVQWAIERLLVDPRFLFRVEQDPADAKSGTMYRVSDLELASRLAFFLWSSLPDDELIDLGAAGRLKDPAVLDQQIRRMLQDERSAALIDGFFGQWLMQRNVAQAKPDLQGFPEFDEQLRRAFVQETRMFVDSQVREDHSVADLLGAKYTFLNERLARHYDIPKVYGTHFRRVDLSGDRRAGLLGQGSILLVTSYADRTSPVQRGKWLLQNILGSPPPEPPANVPPFPENSGTDLPKSVRARLEMHRKNPVCASCHSQMDPLGFALENFDAIGGWRTVDGVTEIDPSGAFPSGEKFDGPAEFRERLLAQPDQFVGTVTEKLMIYALGRGVEYYDLPVVRQIVRDAAQSDYKWSSVILGIAKSLPFQMRRAL